MYIVKRNKKITSSALLIFCVLFIFVAGCAKGDTPKNISENNIYPKEDLTKAKVFDTPNNEKVVSLNKEDREYILQTLKNSKKDLVTEYESGLV